MMDEQQIKAFLDDLFENVLPCGAVDRLSDFYTEDVVGHQNNQKFYLDDIKRRSKTLKRHFLAFLFKIENFLVLSEFIVIVVRQQWIEKKNKQFCEAILVMVYRMRSDKICEIWILANHHLENYQIQNAGFKSNWKLFVDEKSKKSFASRLSMIEFFNKNPDVRFSAMEQKCFYFYVNGLTAKEIAKLLNLSYRTVETYIANVKIKLNCHTKNEMRNKFFQKIVNQKE